MERKEKADIVIVGAGCGGMSAALHAVENGAESVIILDQLSKTGGVLNVTYGTISGAKTVIQELDDLTEDSIEAYKADLMKEGSKEGGIPNEKLIDVYVNEARESINWLWENGMNNYTYRTDEQGRRTVFASEHTLYSYPRTYKILPKDPRKYRAGVHEILDQLIEMEPKIKVVLGTFAEKLAVNENGQVLIVEAVHKKSGEKVKYSAKKGLIMATGGYAANAKLMSFFNSDLNGVITGGMPTSDGYGIYMMQEVGGSINEKSMAWLPTYPMGLENPNAPGTGRIMSTKTQFAGGILVNKEGRRFVDETHINPVIREVAQTKQTDGVQFEIFTDKIVDDLFKTSQAYMYKMFFMSELGKKHILEGDSLEELAEKMRVPADNLIKTVEDYNKVVEEGGTDSFGRVCSANDNPYNLMQNKIEGTKYYAVAVKPLALLTLGGIEANEKMQVLDMNGDPIPGLYCAGEVMAVWGRYFSSGVGITGSISFGRIAARAIMKEEAAGGYIPKPASNLIDKNLFVKDR